MKKTLFALIFIVLFSLGVNAEDNKICLSSLEMDSWNRYTGNLGDSCLFNLDKQGLPGLDNKYFRNGNEGVDGTIYENGFEAWIARWNPRAEISWVSATYVLNRKYNYLTGNTGLIKSYNTTNFDTTLYFYGDDELLYSQRLTDESWEYSFHINISNVKTLTIKVLDNVATKGGTSFAIYDLFLHKSASSTSVLDVPSGKYGFRIIDNIGNPIENATVRWENGILSDYGVTDSNGCVYLDKFSVDNPLITVEKDNFISWTNEDSNWQKSDKNYEEITLFPVSLSDLRIVSAKYSNNRNLTMCVDVLKETKKISIDSGNSAIADLNSGNFYLSCEAKDTSKVLKYELWQNDKYISMSYDGVFALNTDSFKEGDGVFIRAINRTHSYADTRVNLTFKNTNAVEETSLDIGGKGATFTLGDDIPFVGGQTISFNCPINIPVTTYISDNKIKITFNCQQIDQKEVNSKFKEIKKTCDTAKKYGSMPLDSNTAKKIKSFVKKQNKVKLFKDYDVTFFGYAEADVGATIATANLYMLIEASLIKADFNTVVVIVIPVPITIQFDIDFSLQAGATASYNWGNSTLIGNFYINPSLILEAFGGFGIGRAVGVGPYGTATLAANVNLIGTPSGVQNVTLTGELGVKAYLGFMEGKKAFAYNTWHLYTANQVSSASLMSENNHSYDDLYEASNYKVSDLSYVQNESPWLGEEICASLFGVEAKTTFNSLLEGTYRNAQPVMVSDGISLYAAFLRADSDENISVSISKYDECVWETPKSILYEDLQDVTNKSQDEILLDATLLYKQQLCDSPCIISDKNGEIWVAFVFNEKNIDKLSLLDYADATSIAVGTINKNTLEFNQKAVFSSNNYLHSPKLAIINSVPTLVYIESVVTDENSVLVPTNNSFHIVDLSIEETTTQLFKSVDMEVYSYDIGVVDDMVAIAIANENTYLITRDNETLIAEGEVGKITFNKLPSSETESFIWNKNDCLVSYDGKKIEIPGITSEYAITDTGIFYSAATGENANLFVVKYTDEGYTSPIQLTDDALYLQNVSVGKIGEAEYIMGMQTFVTITEDDVIDEKNLVWASVMPVSDIIISNISYDVESLVAGEDVAVAVEITNGGDHIISSIDFSLDGVAYSTEQCALAPGEKAEFTVTITCPAAVQSYVIYASESDEDDYYPVNNEYTLTLGYSDLVLETVERKINGQNEIVAYVTNEGVEAASGMVSFTNSERETITSAEIDALLPGETMVVIATIDNAALSEEGENVTVEIETDSQELYTYNNTDSRFLTKVTYEDSITRFELVDTTVYVEVLNSSSFSGHLVVAEYDSSGKMTAIHINELFYENNELSFVLTGVNTAKIQLMILDLTYAPICESKTITIE